MSFVRSKEIPPKSGNWYDYEVMTTHVNGHVLQKVVKYLGKAGTYSKSDLIGSTSSTAITGNQIPVKQTALVDPKIMCKFCQSEHTRKYGLYKGVQNYFCNDCHRKFIGTDALSHGRVSPSHIANALTEYYSGMSAHDIEDNIEQKTDGEISHTAIQKWIGKYTREAIKETKDLHPQVGDKWIADETYIQTDEKTTDPKGVVFWDIIDSDTRFLLASRVTTTRNKQDARKLMELAEQRAGKKPKIVLTDKLGAYIDGVELAFGSDTEHRQGSPFNTDADNTSLIERFHNTLKDRTKVMRDLKNTRTLKRFTDGWLVHYNFMRPDMALNDKTPAEVAGLNYKYHNWTEVVGVEKEPLIQILTPEVQEVKSA